MTDYLNFSRRDWKPLSFGVLLMALSSFGQTFYIALFGEHLRADFKLSNGELGSIYALATIASAFTLTRVGRWIDHTSVERYTIGVAVVLAGACVSMAFGQNIVLLAISLYFLRLGGQGLMVHTAKTTVARHFSNNRGKALSIASMGISASEGLLPIAVVAGILLIGWRNTWLAGAAVVIIGTLAALRALPKNLADKEMEGIAGIPDMRSTATLSLWRDKRLLLTLPALLTTPFISTGFFFHQASLAQEKGWSLAWVATCFVSFALARIVATLATGPLVDRFGALRILPYCLLPIAGSVTILAFFSHSLSVPFYLATMGIAAGASSILATAVWVELFGIRQLARVRSSVAAAEVLASGLAPVVMGWLIDFGLPFSTQALICLAVLAIIGLSSRRCSELAPSPASV